MSRCSTWLGILALSTLVGCGGAGDGEPSASHSQDVVDAQVADTVVQADVGVVDGAPVDPGSALEPVDVTGDSEGDETDVGGSPAPVPDYLVITAVGLLEAAEAFAAHRVTTGHTPLVRTVEDVAGAGASRDEVIAALTSWVDHHFEARDAGRPFYLLIVGDADESYSEPDVMVPASYWPGAGYQPCWSDNVYGDMDGDHVPDLALGRLPIRTPAEGLAILKKVVEHETTYQVGPWNHRVSVFAGQAGFGAEADMAIEWLGQKGLEAVPYGYEVLFAYDNPQSAYYYAPFSEKVLDLLTSGSVLVSYVGHGGGELDVPNLSEVVVQHRYPMCAFFACTTGDFLSPSETPPEIVLKQPGGPMAMLVSTELTSAYGNAVNALELEAAVFAERPETFGEAVRLMKWRSRYHTDELRELIDAVMVELIGAAEIDAIISDHMYSYHLLGDPAIRLRLPPQKVSLDAGDADVDAGQAQAFGGTVENLVDGTAHVWLVCERSRVLHELAEIESPTATASQPIVQENWQKALDHTVVEMELPIVAGSFSGELEVPLDTPPGTYYLRVYAEDGVKDAEGSTMVDIRKPKKR